MATKTPYQSYSHTVNGEIGEIGGAYSHTVNITHLLGILKF